MCIKIASYCIDQVCYVQDITHNEKTQIISGFLNLLYLSLET